MIPFTDKKSSIGMFLLALKKFKLFGLSSLPITRTRPHFNFFNFFEKSLVFLLSSSALFKIIKLPLAYLDERACLSPSFLIFFVRENAWLLGLGPLYTPPFLKIGALLEPWRPLPEPF